MVAKTLSVKTIILLIFIPISVFSETEKNQVCFNFYIITKSADKLSEDEVYNKQKKIIAKQFENTIKVFEQNKIRNCPAIEFKRGIIKRIDWQSALLLSQPVDLNEYQGIDIYYLTKVEESLKSLQKITGVINSAKKLKYYSFLEYQPIRKIVYAEQALKKLKILNFPDKYNHFEQLIKNESEVIMKKMEEFEMNSIELLQKDRKRVKKYGIIDDTSAKSWQTGEMILWNDLEAQNTSIELKNLLNRYRTPENQCLDVYQVPSITSPSRNIKEAEKNGGLTDRGGAAISSFDFPRTTANKGHAIIMSYDSGPFDNILAHELGHLLINVKDAHKDKKEKDLMFGHSRGGSYLSKVECREIYINLKTFYGGKPIN